MQARFKFTTGFKGLTPKGVAMWPWLSKPDTKFKEEGEYRIGVRLSGEEAEQFKTKIEQARDAAHQEYKVGTKKSPKKADVPCKPVLDDEGNETGDYDFTFKAKAGVLKDGVLIPKAPPLLVDAKRNPIKAAVGNGSQVKVSYNVNPWMTPALGVGISLQLLGVQVLDLVEFGGSSASANDFDEEEGYEAKEAVSTKADDEGGVGEDDPSDF